MSKATALKPPDTHFFSASLGWLGLGNIKEAESELEQISAPGQSHPDVLEVRWEICHRKRDWLGAVQAARRLIEVAPGRPSGWLHYAYATRRAPTGGLPRAFEILSEAIQKFRKKPIIPFNLACYACQMNEIEQAREYLKIAMSVGGKNEIKALALQDTDLERLWEEVRDL